MQTNRNIAAEEDVKRKPQLRRQPSHHHIIQHMTQENIPVTNALKHMNRDPIFILSTDFF